jgi:hypothetical protein
MRISLALAILTLGACGATETRFTLYRNSVTDTNMRIHVATFDASDGAAYNSENCNIAAGLFKVQPGTTVRYWCEKGSYRK